jgi:hypothetical protein
MMRPVLNLRTHTTELIGSFAQVCKNQLPDYRYF